MSKIKRFAEDLFGEDWANNLQEINKGESNGKSKRQAEDR